MGWRKIFQRISIDFEINRKILRIDYKSLHGLAPHDIIHKTLSKLLVKSMLKSHSLLAFFFFFLICQLHSYHWALCMLFPLLGKIFLPQISWVNPTHPPDFSLIITPCWMFLLPSSKLYICWYDLKKLASIFPTGLYEAENMSPFTSPEEPLLLE